MRVIRIFSLIVSLLLFQSCLPSLELSQRAIVEAIGIDKKDGKFVVSIEYYAPDSDGQKSTKTAFIKESDRSISSAISKIASKINKELYFGHNYFIVIGSKAAENDIIYILEHFDADAQTKADICVFVAETAEKLLDNENDPNISPIAILENIERLIKNDTLCEYKLFKILDKSNSDFTFALPFGRLTEDLYFELDGYCLFEDGVLIK